MITKEQIENQIDILAKIKKAKEEYEAGTLKINWETDIEKMEFSKLRSKPPVNREKIKIEYVEMSDNWGLDLKSGVTFDDMLEAGGRSIMCDLLQVVMSDTKVIPPVGYRGFTIVDGVKSDNYSTSFDGAHRALLSHFLGLKEIPMLLEDRIMWYSFTPDRWTFTVENETLFVSAVDGDEVHEFNLSDYIIDERDINFFRLQKNN